MNITLTGPPGSGKTVVGKLLAEKLGYEFISIGDIKRDLAAKKGLSISEIDHPDDINVELDKELDSITKNFKTKNNVVIDGKVAFHFLPDSIKIFLDVNSEESAKRIFKDKRAQEKFKTIEEVKKDVEKRIHDIRSRWKEKYNVDFLNRTNFDILIDTSGQVTEDVVKELHKLISNHLVN